MGLLDDAIREHLELKRQHGADPDEVSRQEQEALGAARRAEFARTAEDADQAPAEPAAHEPVESEPVAEESAAPPEVATEDPVPPPPPPEAEPVAEEPVQAPPAAEPEPREPFDAEAIEPEAAEPPPRPREAEPWLDDEPDEVPADESLDPARPAEDAGSRDDVLEETPDFLQETPEHERLWFEQRPPRDFDWDK